MGLETRSPTPRPAVRSPLAAFLVAACLFATPARVAAPDGTPDGAPGRNVDEVVAEGKRVVVRSTAPSKALAEKCRDAIDAAIPVYEKNLPYRMPAGERLVVRLYATANEYTAAVTEGGAAWLSRNNAATLASTKESYLVVAPRSDPEFLVLVGDLPEQTRFLACHEGVHQFLRRAGAPGMDFWPAWYAEGMADWLAEQCLAAGAPPGAAPPVYVDDHRHVVVDALARGAGIGLERLLHVEMGSFTDLRLAYGHTHELFRLLAADPARLARLHQAIRGLGVPGEPGAGARDDRRVDEAKACADALVATYGPLPALEEAFRKQEAATHPRWFQQLRASEATADGIVCAGLPDENAIAISGAAPPGKPFAISFEVQVVPVGPKQADLYLGYERPSDPQWVKIAMGSAGFVTLLAYADGYWQDRYKRNADVPPETFAPGTWVPVRVVVERATLRVEVRGKSVLETSVPPGYDVLHGSYGFGATRGVARFRKIEVVANR